MWEKNLVHILGSHFFESLDQLLKHTGQGTAPSSVIQARNEQVRLGLLLDLAMNYVANTLPID